MASRLSLAGAQAKMGLYHNGDDPATGWFLPKGSAPSTHIIKASDGTFPHLIINEALCLATARNLGFDTTEFFFVPVDKTEPLLAVKRFDRTITNDAQIIDGLFVPNRLHQEDFCQAAGLPSYYKYEPTDGHYLNKAANLITQSVRNPFGDKVMFFTRILFDHLIGNCDNHLKNHSFILSAAWDSRELSPLYDVTCTTYYPELAQEMGVSLCPSRRIDDVSTSDILVSAERLGLGERFAWQQYQQLCESFLPALLRAEQELVEQGYEMASSIADFIRKNAQKRLSLAR
ncbi:MAG: HipA domain-containing protein [Coriobacteriales bacterium]|nr:HipA domain-containing protein [Coriobacteriales bacterium]